MPLELTDADIIRKPRAGAMRSSAIELTDADVIRRKRPESRQVGFEDTRVFTFSKKPLVYLNLQALMTPSAHIS